MWRHHLAVWATHPLAHGWHRTIADRPTPRFLSGRAPVEVAR